MAFLRATVTKRVTLTNKDVRITVKATGDTPTVRSETFVISTNVTEDEIRQRVIDWFNGLNKQDETKSAFQVGTEIDLTPIDPKLLSTGVLHASKRTTTASTGRGSKTRGARKRG